MSETYLNGKITVSSLTAPTEEDIRQIEALSPDERLELMREAIKQGIESGVSKRSMEEIRQAARAKALGRSG
ncbi:hypothetical protein FF098_016470 [Parvularcula flava]|uniref:Uncharacterized protein n=1 Tax=Aquisalinus luteolus TaxID=1566827 RepID=A0A8J3EQC8_9PROT|nr:hypothetical protein [Aquisalinus luteolus]NHK29505.1 hypothetical protein [Aquisalinus luteolus]GGI01737.1 hypothetical protein GCM10011355_33080 [Aquisalinus luteolus]